MNKFRVRNNVLQETNTALSQRITQMKEDLERERILKLAPRPGADGNVDPEAHANFETSLMDIIRNYVTENEQINLRLGEATAECAEYKKKYLNLHRRQEELGQTSGLLGSPYATFDDNPLIQSARKEMEDQKKMVESEFSLRLNNS